MTLSVSPEYALLLRAAAPPPIRRGLASAPTAVDWARLLELARWHRLSPLLWRYLADVRVEPEVPPAVLHELRSDYRDTAARNMVLASHLDQVLATLESSGIRGMLLKGSALVRTAYPDMALRPMGDIDVLVRADALREAHKVVEGMGYTAMGATLSRDDDKRVAGHFHHYPLMSADGSTVIELHQHVTRASPSFPIDGYWERAVPVEGSRAYLLPSPEDLFLHVGVHFAEDRLSRQKFALGQLADLLWVAHRWPLDWSVLAQRARRYGEGDRLFLALISLAHLFGDAVPSGVVAELRPDSYRPDMGSRFVKLRILDTRPSISLEYYARRQWRLFPGREALELHVRYGEFDQPRLGRLRLRRVISRVRRLVYGLVSPARLVADIRLSLWTLRLRGGRNTEKLPG